jgi:uncharacterized ion transporter superfamily protein YfcC
LIVFALGFVVMIYGVQQLGWYFTEIAVVFLAVTYILVFADGIAEEVHDRITDKTVFHHDTDRTS